jgi:hypothetical protein
MKGERARLDPARENLFALPEQAFRIDLLTYPSLVGDSASRS